MLSKGPVRASSRTASPVAFAPSRGIAHWGTRTAPNGHLLISLVAGAFGYTGIARGAAQISKILFFVFIVLFLVILILAITAGELVF